MKKRLTARTSITIHAPAAKAWEALTEPELIKQYLFGTEAVSDWKVGSSIAYKGVWEGKSYEDKWRILQLVPERLLQSTYWSSMGGLEDKPENYVTVTYQLEAKDNNTQLTVSVENIATEKERDHMETNWGMVLKTMKKLLEK